MNPIKAVILDDEYDSINLLQLALARNCPDVIAIATFTNPLQALEHITELAPDVLFLDIEMPGMNGFEFLDKLGSSSFQVIFVTAYNQYAVKAFRLNALDYLIKPIDFTDLKEAVIRIGKNRDTFSEQVHLARQQIMGAQIKKVAIHTQNGVIFLNLEDIIYAEASNNYTRLILNNGKPVIISKTMKDVQEVLEESHFLRIHRQYLVNLNCVKKFNRNDSILTMADETQLPVARSQKEKLMERYGWL